MELASCLPRMVPIGNACNAHAFTAHCLFCHSRPSHPTAVLPCCLCNQHLRRHSPLPAAGGPPPLPPHEAPPLPEEEPDAKRARLDTFVLTPEEEFADAHPGQAKVSGGWGVESVGCGCRGRLFSMC